MKKQLLYNMKFFIFSYHSNYYKLIGIGLTRQANTITPQKTNFTGKLEEDNVFYNWKASKNYLSLDLLVLIE